MGAVLSIDRLPAKSMKRIENEYSYRKSGSNRYGGTKHFSNVRSSGDFGPGVEQAAV